MSQGEMKKLFNDLQGSDIRFLYAYVNIRASVHVLRIHATIVVCVLLCKVSIHNEHTFMCYFLCYRHQGYWMVEWRHGKMLNCHWLHTEELTWFVVIPTPEYHILFTLHLCRVQKMKTCRIY